VPSAMSRVRTSPALPLGVVGGQERPFPPISISVQAATYNLNTLYQTELP
jgi:hypothetical protein